MYFSETVLVVRTGRFKEYDLWVRFLSPSKGILTGFAFGGCRSRKRFSGCLDVLNLVLFKISSGKRNRYLVLEEGSLINGYPSLKNDSSRLGMAVNSLRFAQKLCPEGDDCSGIYALMLDYLEAMENNYHVPSFFPLLFRARAVFSHGFQPALNICCRCGRTLHDMVRPGFLFAEGKIVCGMCRQKDDLVLGTHRDSLLFLNGLNKSHPSQWLEWTPESIILQDCFQVVESFVQYHLEDGSYN
ncbi:MAG: DNA repair protein RecO [Desulfonatronovibrio sp.]